MNRHTKFRFVVFACLLIAGPAYASSEPLIGEFTDPHKDLIRRGTGSGHAKVFIILL